MGAGKLEHNSYFSIMEGKVCRQFKTPTENTKTRVNKNGKTVHEELYDYIDGTITGITTKDSDFGRFWVIVLMDGGTKQILQLNYSSGYSNAFLKTLPNVDLQKKVCLIPKQDIQPDGKKKTTLFITQGGKAVKWYYTKDDKKDLPDLIVKEGKGKDKGKKIYDDSEVMEFLEAMVMDEIVPQLPVSDEEIEVDSETAAEVTNESGWKPVEEDSPASTAGKSSPKKPVAKGSAVTKGKGKDDKSTAKKKKPF